MSCHVSSSVIALSLFQGVAGVVAGANPSCLWVKAGYTLDKWPSLMETAHQEQFGVQYLAHGHFDMQLNSVQGSWDLNQQPTDHNCKVKLTLSSTLFFCNTGTIPQM